MGGGFPNTELRSISDKRVFDFFDFITLDDGEVPIEELIRHIEDPNYNSFKRTFLFENGKVVYKIILYNPIINKHSWERPIIQIYYWTSIFQL